jgi:branched-chain amino acid transport system ATP-binding protein
MTNVVQFQGLTGSADSILTVSAIEVAYDDTVLAVENVSLSVARGSIVALLGANGAGKSTTLKAISGLGAADLAKVRRGTIEFEGKDIVGIRANQLAAQGIVHVLEGRHCFSQLTVEENVLAGGFVRRPSQSELKRSLEQVYTWFPRLKEKRKTKAGLTSGGEQQMTAIGRALMTKPKLMLLDEPSMGLAPIIVQEIFEIIRNLNKSEGVSFLLAEQNANLALKYANHAYILENGHVAISGTAEELRLREDVHDFYLGGSAA